MVIMITMHPHRHQATAPPPSHHVTPPPPPPPPPPHSSISLRSPTPSPANNNHNNNTNSTPTSTTTQQPHSFNSLIPLGRDHFLPIGPGPAQTQTQEPAGSVLTRVRLSDILPYDGAPVGPYLRAVEALSGSLMRHNAAVVEVGRDDAALLRCGLESARLFFRTRTAQGGGVWGKGGRGLYMYRPGRPLEDMDLPPPCTADVFRCMGKAARAALCAIARHLRLRSDVFNHLLDDNPLPANEASSSVLVATFSATHLPNGKGSVGGGKLATNGEIEKGLLTLISSDAPGLQVCDPNGRWYLADSGLEPGDLLLLTGKALSHATAGLRPAASYRSALDNSPGTSGGGRTSLAFRLMPQGNAILDCSPISAAGHVIPQSYVPISVAQFMDDLSVEEDVLCNQTDIACVAQDNMNREPSLRSVLSDPLSGAFLEDAMLVSCGHSFGGLMLRRVIDTSRCTLCNAEIETRSLIPNHALRAAAAAVKHEDDRRLFHNAALRKRRKEIGDHRENGDVPSENGQHRGVQYPFSVNEKVIIKGNRRTPDKFVGKEAVITSQCLNGWYLLKIIETGENVRLQYRSLRKIQTSQDAEEGELVCEDLPVGMCSFAISSPGKRCLLETYKANDGPSKFQCKTSEVVVNNNMREYIETDQCINACGFDRTVVRISSDTLLDPRFAAKICSPDCSENCPNIVDLHRDLALGEGMVLSDLCRALRNSPRRAMSQLVSSGVASGPVADAPFSSSEAWGPAASIESSALAPVPFN